MSEDSHPHICEISRAVIRDKEGKSIAHRYWVECKCGYRAGPYQSMHDANDEADEHVLGSI